MGLVYAEIEIINGGDREMVRRNLMDDVDVKRIRVKALVDIWSYMLCINENIQEQLQLPIVEKRKAKTADGRILEMDVVSNVEMKFKNRRSSCCAMVLPGASKVLLGRRSLNDMHVLINPLKQELMVNPKHPFFAQMKLK